MLRKSTWIVKRQPDAEIKKLCTVLNVSALIAKLLYNRGMDTPEKAKTFLNKSIDGLNDPFLLPDMEKAVIRIRTAIKNKEKILIYGDYDVDGVTAVSTLYLYLSSVNADVSYYIPDRNGEGYGVNRDALTKAEQDGVTLVITVDTGITAIDEVAYASSIGVEIIITDHHECAENLPDALAIINPKRSDSCYPFQELAGVGVAFKLACALDGRENLQRMIDEYSQLVCLGTVADVMPLVGENRIMVSCGLKRLEKTDNFGLKALMERSGILGRRITASMVGFSICPRINAAGRMGCAMRAVELFLASNSLKAIGIANELCSVNRKRQEEENVILEEAVFQIEHDMSYQKDKVLVLWSATWHHGVIGVVASRLTEKYGKPAILISVDGEIGKGSGRSIKGFSLYQALTFCSLRLLKFGGHDLAAGMSISIDEIDAFRREINSYAATRLDKEALCMPVEADCELEADDISVQKAMEILFLEPYGMGNRAPVFLIKDAVLDEILSIGNDKHMKFGLHKQENSFSAVYFGHSTSAFDLCCGDCVDLICNMDVNHYRNEQNVQLVVQDIALSGAVCTRQDKYEDIYQRYISRETVKREEILTVLPVREDFVAVYRCLLSDKGQSENMELLVRRIEHNAERLNYCKIRLCFDIFEEMGLIAVTEKEDQCTVMCLKTVEKINLDVSNILIDLREKLR